MTSVAASKLALCQLHAPRPLPLSPSSQQAVLFPHQVFPRVLVFPVGATFYARNYSFRASQSPSVTGLKPRALFSGRQHSWAASEKKFLSGTAGKLREVKRRESSAGGRFRSGPRASDEGNVSQKDYGEGPNTTAHKVWRADNEWLAKHGIPTFEIDAPGQLPRLHLNSKLDLPLVKLPPSLEWLDLYGEPQVNLRKKLAVNLDPFGEPQVKLRERLAVNLDPFGEPQVKLRERLAVNLDPFGEPQVKLRERLAVTLDPFGEPQVKFREQLAASLSPPLSRPQTPLIFRPPGTVETLPEKKGVKTGKPNRFLEGNFAPVDEECPEEIPCHVIGNLPGDLRGQFLRNGPNPQFPQDPGAYHWFDGDGMVHSLKFQGLDRPPVYSSRYIRTSSFKQEQQLGRGKFWPGVKMEPLGRCLVTAALRSMRRQEGEKDVPGMLAMKNTANTGLAYHAGKLFAMWEGGHPYVVDESLQTKGPTTFDGRLLTSFSAHPKLDQQTGELIYFGYSLVTRPFLSYGVMSKEGEIVHQVNIDLPQPVMMHDFAITEHYSLFLDFPFLFNPKRMMEVTNGKRGKPFVFDGSLCGRIGVLPRFGSASDIQWFTVGPGMVLHVMNAFEETGGLGDSFLDGALSFLSPSNGGEWTESTSNGLDGSGGLSDGGDRKGSERKPVIVLRAMHYDVFTGLGLADVTGGVAACPEDAFLHEYRLDLETGGVEERRINDVSADFPIINASRQGLYNRYGYMSRFAPASTNLCEELGCNFTPLFDALIKIDLETGLTQTHEFGPGRLGGEAAFVPRAPSVQPPGYEEILDQLPSYLQDFLPPGASHRPLGPFATGFEEWSGEANGASGDEDEGWLVVHVWDEALQQSEVLVIDAKDFEGPVLARVVLPRRVPYGFHGTFLPEAVPDLAFGD